MSKIYINTDESLIKEGGRKSISLSTAELKEKVKSILIKAYKDQELSEREIKKELEHMESNGYFDIYEFRETNRQLDKDLQKISFDCENFGTNNDAFGEGSLLGFHTVKNGLSFIGCYAGGDWECPIFFIIYFDGKSLRGYIPMCGNLYNGDTKTVFGNGEDYSGESKNKDNLFLQKELSDKTVEYEDIVSDLDYNWEFIKKDIIARIVVENEGEQLWIEEK